MELHKTFRIIPFKPFTLIDNTQNSTKDQRRWRLHNLKSSQYLINWSTTWKITGIRFWIALNVAWSWPKWLNMHWFALHWLKISKYSKKIVYFPHNFLWSEPEKDKKKETDCCRNDRHPSLSTHRLEGNLFAAEVIIAWFKQYHIFLFFAHNFFVCSEVIFKSSSKPATSSSKSFCESGWGEGGPNALKYRGLAFNDLCCLRHLKQSFTELLCTRHWYSASGWPTAQKVMK